MRRRGAAVAAVVALVLPAAVHYDVATAGSSSGAFVTSWIGNTYGDADDQSVQPGIQGLWVAPDGTAYGEEIWNEAARELRGYQDGKVFGGYTFQHDADIPNGGVAVAGDNDYVYAAVRFGSSADVMRYDRRLNPAGFAGGTDPQTATLIVNHSYEYLTGLAVGGGNLFVSDPDQNIQTSSDDAPERSVIRVYDTASLGKGQVTSFPAPRARGLAVDGDGDLWVLEQADDTNPPQIVRYTPSGTPTGQVVTGIAAPSSITVDTSGGGAGKLLVTDDGPDQDIKIFSDLDSTPTLTSTFGVRGGVNAGPVPGTVGPLRFNGPNGVGVDSAGNIYVANGGVPGLAVQNYGQGVSLEAYTPAGKLLWQDYGQKYNNAAGIDPTTGTDVYTTFDHYTLNLARPVGQQWTRVGWTLNKFSYPNDPRIRWGGDDLLPNSPTVRDIDGRRFLYYGNGMGDVLDIYRFEPPSQTAIPSGGFDVSQAKDSPESGEFIWRDTNGDGDPYGNAAHEYFYPTVHSNMDVTGFFVDSRGDVWQTTHTHGIREFPFGGLDGHGNPIYSYSTMRTFPTPAPFTDPRRLFYDPATDTLVLSGYTTGLPAPSWVDGDYKFAGTVLAEYNDFTTAPTPGLAWKRALPYTWTSSDAAHKPITLSVAGDYAFVGYFTDESNQLNSETDIFNLSNGDPAGILTPGATVGSRSGNLDMQDGTTAYKTPGGIYLVLTEDDGWDKTLMYEWKPPSYDSSAASDRPTIRLGPGRDRHIRRLHPHSREGHRH